MAQQRITPGFVFPRTSLKGGDNDRLATDKVNNNFSEIYRKIKAQKILSHAAKGGLDPVMESPPTVTQQYIGGPSTILTDRDINSPLYPHDDPNLTLYSGKFLPNSDRVGWITSGDILTPVQGFGVRFGTDAEAFEIRLRNINGNGFRVSVDGQWIATADQQQWGGNDFYDGNNHCYWRVDFGSGGSRQRVIDVFFNGYGIDFGGINVGPTSTAATTSATNPYRAWKSTVDNQANCMVFGDSWSVGWGSNNSRGAFPYKVGEFLGIKRIVSSGVGGQGYLTTTGNPAQKFRDRVEDIGRFGSLDLLIVGPAGLNDNWQSPSDLQAEVTLFANEVLERQPEALIAVFGPQRTAAVNLSADIAAAIKAGWLASPLWNQHRMKFFDTFEGRGWFDHQNGNFAQSIYSNDDDNHPNPNGHLYVARRVVDSVKEWLGGLI